MRKSGTIVLIIGIVGFIFFGIKTLIHSGGPDEVEVITTPFVTGYVPVIISGLIIIVGILMLISAGKKVRKKP